MVTPTVAAEVQEAFSAAAATAVLAAAAVAAAPGVVPARARRAAMGSMALGGKVVRRRISQVGLVKESYLVLIQLT
jgi:hypothetical protein